MLVTLAARISASTEDIWATGRHAGPMATTLLIVDDHDEFRRAARALLSSAGFDVTGEADDGTSAIESVSRLQPDAVLLDIQLPGIDGFEVARMVAELPNPPAVVLTSTRAGSSYSERLAHSSALGFIEKQDLSGTMLARLLAAS